MNEIQEITFEGIRGDLISFLGEHIERKNISPEERLSVVLNEAPLGSQGAALEVGHQISQTYGVSSEDLKRIYDLNPTISQASMQIYELAGGRK